MNSSLRFVLLIFALLGLSSALSAQVATGNIVGRVTDASGAIAAGVEVTAINRRNRSNQPCRYRRGRHLPPVVSGSCRLQRYLPEVRL